MRVHLSQALLNHKGEHLKISADGDNATLRDVIEMGLSNYSAQNEEGSAKYVRYKLLKRVASAKGAIELSVEEVAEIKTIVGKSFGPIVVGSTYDALEGVPQE